MLSFQWITTIESFSDSFYIFIRLAELSWATAILGASIQGDVLSNV